MAEPTRFATYGCNYFKFGSATTWKVHKGAQMEYQTRNPTALFMVDNVIVKSTIGVCTSVQSNSNSVHLIAGYYQGSNMDFGGFGHCDYESDSRVRNDTYGEQADGNDSFYTVEKTFKVDNENLQVFTIVGLRSDADELPFEKCDKIFKEAHPDSQIQIDSAKSSSILLRLK